MYNWIEYRHSQYSLYADGRENNISLPSTVVYTLPYRWQQASYHSAIVEWRVCLCVAGRTAVTVIILPLDGINHAVGGIRWTLYEYVNGMDLYRWPSTIVKC